MIETYITETGVPIIRQNWTVIDGRKIAVVKTGTVDAYGWPDAFDLDHVVWIRTGEEWIGLSTETLFAAADAVERIQALLGWNAPSDNGAIGISTTVPWERDFIDADSDSPIDPTH